MSINGYPPNFFRWLDKNRRIYDEFSKRALSMASSGRKHYAARTIVEVIRYETDLSDSEATFKINNNYTPGMARLWMSTYGARFPGFFELRG